MRYGVVYICTLIVAVFFFILAVIIKKQQELEVFEFEGYADLGKEFQGGGLFGGVVSHNEHNETYVDGYFVVVSHTISSFGAKGNRWRSVVNETTIAMYSTSGGRLESGVLGTLDSISNSQHFVASSPDEVLGEFLVLRTTDGDQLEVFVYHTLKGRLHPPKDINIDRVEDISLLAAPATFPEYISWVVLLAGPNGLEVVKLLPDGKPVGEPEKVIDDPVKSVSVLINSFEPTKAVAVYYGDQPHETVGAKLKVLKSTDLLADPSIPSTNIIPTCNHDFKVQGAPNVNNGTFLVVCFDQPLNQNTTLSAVVIDDSGVAPYGPQIVLGFTESFDGNSMRVVFNPYTNLYLVVFIIYRPDDDDNWCLAVKNAWN